jgi:glyoxylase-like metal-dependent hydrolase (beta-lactamase superfamily II)
MKRVLLAALCAAGAWALPVAIHAQQAGTGLQVVPIRGNVFMIVGGDSTITVSAGVDGMLLVDAGSAAMADRALEKIAEIGSLVAGAPARMTTCVGPPCYQAGSNGPFNTFGWTSPSYNAIIASPKALKPIRWIIQTSADPDHTGGTVKIAAAGMTYNGGEAGRLVGERTPATVIAHEFVLKRMTQAKVPEGAWPGETYYLPTYRMSQFINGEGIQMYHAPAAITDADTFVYFRFSDVISAGDLYTPDRYPMIDVAKGGTAQGVIDGLNKIIDLTFPEYRHQGGTMVIGGHGRLGDQADLAIYRNMITVVVDRVRELKKQGMSVQQVKAAKPTLDYDGIYGSPDRFLDAVYQTLK